MTSEERNNYRGKKMKIAINISKRLYEATKNGLDAIDVWNLRKAVRDGTVLRENEITTLEGIEQAYQALRRQRPQPVIEEAGIAARCPYCEASAWMTNADEELNNYCGLCGQRLDWEHPENPDEEEAEETEE